jgi:hypothetical protein
MPGAAAAGGGCACGAVRFEVRGPLRSIAACHCESCRRQSGNFVVATRARVADLVFLSGTEDLAEWRASDQATRRFCRICGSHLFWQRDGSASVSIMAGSLDLPTGLAMSHHIFVAEKGDWYTLDDGLPQHGTWPEAKPSQPG